MAAVLCNFISDLCTGTCDALGKVICLPCRACGMCTKELSEVCKSPFCIYLSVALGLNLPSIVFAGRAAASYGLAGGGGGCSNQLNWMYLNAALCAGNMIAAVYITERIQKEQSMTTTVNQLEDGTYYEAKAYSTGPSGDTSRNNSVDRIKNVLCHDKGVAVYIIFLVVFLIWQSIGMSRWLASGVDCGNGQIATLLFNSLICNWLFITLGATSFICSLCCLR